MKFSESWLREWVETALTSEVLRERLTMAGLEVDSAVPAADSFTDIVVGHVLTREKHPNADKLSCCTVDVGGSEPLSIVCGAKNIAANLKVPVAKIGAVLKGDFKIKKSKLRGELSEGMLFDIGYEDGITPVLAQPEKPVANGVCAG